MVRPVKHEVALRRYALGLPPDLFDLVKALAKEREEPMNDSLIAAVHAWALRQRPEMPGVKALQTKVRNAKAH